MVKGVPENRLKPSFLDQSPQFIFRNSQGRVGPCHMNHPLFQDRSINIIYPEREEDLSHLQAGHNPVRFDMVKIIEIKTCHRMYP